jgi:hypothetical protein
LDIDGNNGGAALRQADAECSTESARRTSDQRDTSLMRLESHLGRSFVRLVRDVGWFAARR